MSAAALRNAVLADFIEQSFVADLQQRRGLFAIPVRLFQGTGDGFGLSFIFGVARQGLQAAGGASTRASAGYIGVQSSTAVGPRLQLGCGKRLVSQNQVALDEIAQFAQVAGPGMAQACLH